MASAAKGSMILIVTFFITSIVNYIFNVGLGWLLVPAEYGVYGVSIALMTILSFFVNSGFPIAASKLISEETCKDELRIFKTSLTCNILLGLFVSIIFWFIYGFLPLENYRSLIFIVILMTILTSVKSVYQYALQGFFRFKEMGALGVLEVFLKLVFGVGLVYIGFGAFGAVTGLFIAGLVSLFVRLFLFRDFKFWRSKGWERRVLFFTFPMFLGMLGFTLIQNLDILVLKFLSPGDTDKLAGLYQAGLLLARIPFFLTGTVMMAVFPFISKGNSNVYSQVSLKYVVLFIFPVSIAITLKPDAFLYLVYPVSYVEAAPVLRVLALGMGFFAIMTVFSNIFQASGKPKIPARLLLITSGLQLGLLFILIPVMGIVGAALATLLACLGGTIGLGYYYWKTYGIEIKISALTSLLMFSLLLYLLPFNSRLEIIASLVIAFGAYMFLLTVFKLLKVEDLYILMEALPAHPLTLTITGNIKSLVYHLNNLF